MYFGYNDTQTRWIQEDDWTYERNFDMTNTDLSESDIVLVCEGLDTVSKLYINKLLIGNSENMFRRYIFHIKHALQVGRNTIRVN